MSSKHIFSVLSKEKTAAGGSSCYLVWAFFISFEDEKMLSGNVHTLAFTQGHRLFSTCAAVPRPLGPRNRDERGLLCRRNWQTGKNIFLVKAVQNRCVFLGSTLYLNYFESPELYIQRLRPLCEQADKLSAHLMPIKLTATVYLSSLLSRRTITSLQEPAAPLLASSPAGNTSREPRDSFRLVCRKMLRCHRRNRK